MSETEEMKEIKENEKMMSLGDMEGKEIITADGYCIGIVQDAQLCEDWKICSLAMNVDRDVGQSMGYHKPFLSSLVLDLPTERINAVSDKVILDKPKDFIGTFIADNDKKTNVSNLRGKQIVGKEGTVIGTVEDIIFDTDSWTLPSLAMKLDKKTVEDLSLKKSLFSLPTIGLTMSHVNDIGDVIMLDVSSKNLSSILDHESVKAM
ncbi:MAG: PRC-barrel domain-containing protein [Candidatus Thermoplasmatota archaeon]|nr:PRC-barrel domain-containing protein [Candidatus Thermoplasmatota archaeon]